jgi:hypothetical protein
MVHITEVSAGFMFLSGVVSLLLLSLSIKGYRRSKNPAMAFVAGAFSIFAIKSFFVGYAILARAVEHESLELIDAIGDLATILMFVFPIFWPRADS